MLLLNKIQIYQSYCTFSWTVILNVYNWRKLKTQILSFFYLILVQPQWLETQLDASLNWASVPRIIDCSALCGSLSSCKCWISSKVKLSLLNQNRTSLAGGIADVCQNLQQNPISSSKDEALQPRTVEWTVERPRALLCSLYFPLREQHILLLRKIC